MSELFIPLAYREMTEDSISSARLLCLDTRTGFKPLFQSWWYVYAGFSKTDFYFFTFVAVLSIGIAAFSAIIATRV
jgi:hypothetical protein